MGKITFEVNEGVLAQAEQVLDHIGLDVETALRMFLKRVSNEGSVSFLLASAPVAAAPVQASEAEEEKGITKSVAKRILAQRGYETGDVVRYSKRNKATRNYWQNLELDLFNGVIFLILNDQFSRTLHLFKIPAGSLCPNDLVVRADKPTMADLQICGDDPCFTDSKSGIRFDRFLQASINY